MTHSIRLRDGSTLDLEDPNYSAVSVANIVYALSGVYRFGGHSPRRLTAAEHTCVGARLLAQPEIAAEVARLLSLNRLSRALREDAATVEALRRAFLVHGFSTAVLHGATSPASESIKRLHAERVAAAYGVPYVQLGGLSLTDYEVAYRAAWVRSEGRVRLYGREIAIPSQAEIEAHLQTAEVWASVHMIDSALCSIELDAAWEIGPARPRFLLGVENAAVDLACSEPDHAYVALLAEVPREWRT